MIVHDAKCGIQTRFLVGSAGSHLLFEVVCTLCSKIKADDAGGLLSILIRV